MSTGLDNRYDTIVVGAGHAGCEAAMAVATMGGKVLLVSMDLEKIANMSCNPAVGGIAKGQIVREIDALGGQMGIITDKSTIQFRMLNRSKGPAMWSPRAQADKRRFSVHWRQLLETTPNVDLVQASVKEILIKNHLAYGVSLDFGLEVKASTVILTTGTFLNGKIFIGQYEGRGGRLGEKQTAALTQQLSAYGIETGRMKTGTPARLDGRSINFEILEEQVGEQTYEKFSYLPDIKRLLPQRSCHITYTNPRVHEVIEEKIKLSSLFTGQIEGIGPRYCPSIETKLETFPDKDKHQLFLEPEGVDTVEYYLNGFSSALPYHVQYDAIHCVRGLEKVKFFRPGYAIEYDFFLPTQLEPTLESKAIENLFLAGQINGTTGYEEAAAQGLIAGINSLQKNRGNPDFLLKRSDAYIGVLIDDLVTRGTDEPYRMFTSRAEHRLLLRQDNADRRLTKKGAEIGMVSKERLKLLEEKETILTGTKEFFEELSVAPEELNDFLQKKKSEPLKQKVKLPNILRRPNVTLSEMKSCIPRLLKYIQETLPKDRAEEILNVAELEIKYEGYLKRELANVSKLERLEDLPIKSEINYDTVSSISTEARQKLKKINPKTIGQAKRIPGVSPADISILITLMGR